MLAHRKTTPGKKLPEVPMSTDACLKQTYLNFILENIAASIIAVDCQGVVTVINRHAEHAFKLDAEGAQGQPLEHLFPGVAGHEHYLLQAIKTGRELKDVEYGYCPYTGREGTFQHNVALIKSPGGEPEGAIWLRRDITDIRRFQKEVNRAEISALVCQIAAATSHEIRNPLTTVRGYLQLAQQLCRHEKPLAGYLESAVLEVDRATAIVSDFLALVHPNEDGLQIIDLNTLTEDVAQLVEKVAFISGIRLSRSLNPKIPPVIIDVRQVKQAILSILYNAMQAMPQGGDLQITTDCYASSGEVCLTISDSGIGISPENISLVCRPFFSTKPSGNGLGLTMVNRIMQHHNGRVSVESEIDRGTEVRLFFPSGS
ncbi:MAG: ATP-binding protein [Firmicutes bacterium]|nr:ATP-binding protein [Bacillota bacterium]